MFVFVVPKHLAYKVVITSYFVSQKAFIIFQKLQRMTKTKKSQKNYKKTRKIATFWAQNS